MNRRLFLRWLGGTAAGAAAAHVLDVERLLWVPGEKTIVLPASSEWIILPGSSDWVARQAMRRLKESITLARVFNREFNDGTVRHGSGLVLSVPITQRWHA